MREFRPADIRFYLHEEFRAAEIRFYLHKEFRALGDSILSTQTVYTVNFFFALRAACSIDYMLYIEKCWGTMRPKMTVFKGRKCVCWGTKFFFPRAARGLYYRLNVID